MKTVAPACSRCSGTYACVSCEQLLRTQLARTHGSASSEASSNASFRTKSFFDEALVRGAFSRTFPVGPRGGALIDFGNAITLECFLPYTTRTLRLRFVPMPLVGEIIHDIGRRRSVSSAEVEQCLRGRCACNRRPTGWQLTRPIVRAMLGVTDAWLNDHGRTLPALLGASWALTYDTVTFMQRVYFAKFLLPTRMESRAARAARGRRRTAIRVNQAVLPTRKPRHERQ
jgi:hypothetical protein